MQKIELGDDLLRYQALLEDGSVADEVTILPRDERLAHRITAVEARAASARHVEVQLSKPFDATSLEGTDWALTPAREVFGVVAGSEVSEVLALVNSATLSELDDTLGLDARAAKNIVEHRAGADGELDTDDDRAFETWDELDDISYVGEGALARLSEFALGGSENRQNVVTLRVEPLELNEIYRVSVGEVADTTGVSTAAGTTVSFVNAARDERADAPADGGGAADGGGCSSAGGSETGAPYWLLAIAGLYASRRRTRRKRIAA